MSEVKIKGFCPMGCGETLFVENEYITCVRRECPNKEAASQILHDKETEHIVVVYSDFFEIRHPMRERIEGWREGGSLFDCALHEWMKNQYGPPVGPGRYRVREQSDPVSPWFFEPADWTAPSEPPDHRPVN